MAIDFSGQAFLAGAVDAGKAQGFKVKGVIPARRGPIVKPKRQPPLRCEECNLFVSRARAYELDDWEDVDHHEGIYRRHLWLVTDCQVCGHVQTIEEVKGE